MRYSMESLLSAAFTFASGAPLSLSAANARLWAIGYVWSMGEIRSRFSKLELELHAATLS